MVAIEPANRSHPMEITTIDLDLARQVLQVHGGDAAATT